jgi:NAD(P)H-flavin reductase
LSKPSDAWPGRRGYVQEHVADVAPPLGDAPVYLCGRSAMVDAVREVLAALGVAPERIHTERHG